MSAFLTLSHSEIEEMLSEDGLNESNSIFEIVKDHSNSFIETFEDMPLIDKLDFTTDSIPTLDVLIDEIWGPEDGPSEESIENVIKVFGGYLGRTLANSFEGLWIHNGREPVFMIFINGIPSGNGLMPYTYIQNRLESKELLSEQWEDIEAFTR